MEAVRGAGVVVTGAGNGIGAALARRLPAESDRVVVNDIDVGTVPARRPPSGGSGDTHDGRSAIS
jgi:NAD(P)-dependent dehydrogenase (short-subunit alcohol dehydrogenase family)